MKLIRLLDVDEICPFCEQASLKEITYSDVFNFDGNDLTIPCLVGRECLGCGEVMVHFQDLRKNQDTIRAARKAYTGD